MTVAERDNLVTALRGNADQGLALLMGRRTEFLRSTTHLDDETQVIDAIKSVPCHY